MNFRHTLFIFAIVSMLLALPTVQAHTPTTAGENESLDTAKIINDPTKSWAIYAELHEGGEAQYYKFDLEAGQTILVELFIPTDPSLGDFTPSFVLMGHDIESSGVVPDFVEVPEGEGALVVNGIKPDQATFEPFSPGSFYTLAKIVMDAPSTDTYYVAVFEPSQGGRYGLAIGEREAFTIDEFILIPINVIMVHQWEGQNVALIFTPLIVTVVVGYALIFWRWRPLRSLKLIEWAGSLAGLIFLGTGAMAFTQMAIALTAAPAGAELIVTVMFAIFPIILGIVTLLAALRPERRTIIRTRIYLVILGILALFAWTGLIVGPVMAFVASVLPIKMIQESETKTKTQTKATPQESK